MLLIDEKKLSQTTIEAIGHNYGISDAGLMFDEYAKKVCQVLSINKGSRRIFDSKIIRPLRLCGLRMYLFLLSGRPQTYAEYADWQGVEVNRSLRNDFTSGMEDLRRNGIVEEEVP